MVIAYLRISTGKQHIANQQDEIMRFALSKDLEIHKWVTEVVSGKKAKKERKLGKTLRRLKQGDILIVTELSRLSRTLTEIMSIVGECLERKITIYSTKDGYAFDDSINSKVLCFAFGLVAEIERNLISMRTKEALALRRAEGIQLRRRKGSCTKLQILIDNRNDVIKNSNTDSRSSGFAVTTAFPRYIQQIPESLCLGSGTDRETTTTGELSRVTGS